VVAQNASVKYLKICASVLISQQHHERFNNWNEVASDLLPSAMELLEHDVILHFPKPQLSETVKKLVQSQIVGAFLEIAHCDFISVELHQPLMKLYKQGHFPCGWHVNSPEDFPRQAVIYAW